MVMPVECQCSRQRPCLFDRLLLQHRKLDGGGVMVVCGCVCMRTRSFPYGWDSFLLETTVESSGGELWLSGDPFVLKNPSNTLCLNLQEHKSETSDPGDNVNL